MITLKNVSKVYNKNKPNELKALNGVNLHIDNGEFVAIVGPSGAGKSTLLHIIACIDSADEGDYELDGVDIATLKGNHFDRIRNEKVGIVLQDFALIDEYTVEQNVMCPLFFSYTKKAKQRKILVDNALKATGISKIRHQLAWSLSGGQKQRVAIARAIVNNPKIVLADEPTGALDSKNSAAIMDLLKTLNKNGCTVLIITHNMDVAKDCSRILTITDGLLSES